MPTTPTPRVMPESERCLGYAQQAAVKLLEVADHLELACQCVPAGVGGPQRFVLSTLVDMVRDHVDQIRELEGWLA